MVHFCIPSIGPAATGGGGTNYVHWGKNLCNNSEILYTGRAAGAWYGSAAGGGGADILCLPDEPQFHAEVSAGLQPNTQRNRIYGSEYQTQDSPVSALQSLADFNVPCAVCYSEDRNDNLMIPGLISCPQSWNFEYNGYLFSDHRGHSRQNYICIDADAEGVPDSHDTGDGPSLLYHSEVGCNGLDCTSAYVEGAELSCVVCSK